MKPSTLRLRTEALTELASDELTLVSGGIPTNASCALDCPRPTTIVATGECITLPVNQCLISFGCE